MSRWLLQWLMIILLLAPVASLARPPASSPRHPPRVARAIKAKRARLVQLFRKAGLSYPAHQVFIRIFKEERSLELWARKRRGVFRSVTRYPICAASGQPGPKRRQGDLQVPEGFYHVRVFNPHSAFHLSMGINYPNRSDHRLGRRGNLGGAIMIHGDCVSIGCVAITDDRIEEVYVASYDAWRRGKRRVVVHIFPTHLDAKGMARLEKRHASRPDLVRFWRRLRPGYAHFQEHHTLPRVRVDRAGHYRVTSRVTSMR